MVSVFVCIYYSIETPFGPALKQLVSYKPSLLLEFLLPYIDAAEPETSHGRVDAVFTPYL